ncbi:FAD-dependent oxidoreductase [Natronolimnohabitans sp. A-GB9]|uniref:FAD-dependent oxidoreductase n=1 Tax=Natronolimnohabitans sp. A-GB9 TaxID=3069757 RepID=UPI0027B6E02C|nr:FAD-dependent oxidoreductase [Natronolimnohabitans sp. A-GB9]MDQ2051113.1 FAD-dependent oxidoreductase [Natronolimnohabitans sp. A-GB9]
MPDFSRGSDLPGEPTSPWLAKTLESAPSDPTERRSERFDHDPLSTDRSVDVAVIGGGIAGLSTAIEGRKRGQSVAVLERDHVAAGTTGKSTAKLTSQHGLIYDHLRREFGRRQAHQYAQVQEDAIDTVERRVDELDVDCGFERHPSYLYSNEPDEIRREADAAQAAGLEATYVTSVPPFERAQAAVRFEEQAWFDPRSYLLAIAAELAADDGAGIYEGTRVTDVEPGSPPRVHTREATVTARKVVLATGFPLLDRAGYFARMHPKRSYVLGIRLDGDPPEGMYYRSGDNYRSVRTHRDDDGELLLVGGEDHKTGQGSPTGERYRRLERWARNRFPVDEIAYSWSTQDYVTADKVPFVGRAGPRAENVLVATGFRGWGMTNGVAAGRALAERIAGGKPQARELFSPLRFTPKTSLADTLTENADAVSQFATDWARTLLASDLESLDPGEGTVVRRGGKPIACARDDDGELHTTSAVCTHMYCLVEWNDAERSWDCPCHGSRFSLEGERLEGPATEDLSTQGSTPERPPRRDSDW